MVLRMIWILPPMDIVSPQYLWKGRIALESFNIHVPGKYDKSVGPEEEHTVSSTNKNPTTLGKGNRYVGEGKELLTFPYDKVAEKTLEDTMRMKVDPFESECQEIMKQHKNK